MDDDVDEDDAEAMVAVKTVMPLRPRALAPRTPRSTDEARAAVSKAPRLASNACSGSAQQLELLPRLSRTSSADSPTKKPKTFVAEFAWSERH